MENLKCFFEAQERLRDILSGYENMLGRSCESERESDAAKTLMGTRAHGTAQRAAAATAAAEAPVVDMVEG